MRAHFLATAGSGPVDLNQPGTYLHWSGESGAEMWLQLNQVLSACGATTPRSR